MNQRRYPMRRADRVSGSPGEISWRGWLTIVRRVAHGVSRDDISVYAAAISFLALFAIFSAISAFVAFYGLFASPKAVVDAMKEFRGFVPADVIVSLIRQMESVATRSGPTLWAAGMFSLVVSVWCAQQGVATLMAALNMAYRERMTDSALRHLLKSLFVAVEVILGLMIAAVLAIGLAVMVRKLGGSILLAEGTRLAGMALAGLLLYYGLAALYRWVPDRRPPRWRWVRLGAALVVGFWTVASIMFSVFLAYSNTYTAMYGSLSGVVLLLTLTYITVLTVLIGAEVNAQLEYHTKRDTTIDARRPMGRRGAYVADHVADDAADTIDREPR